MTLRLQIIISIFVAIQGAEALQSSYDTDTGPRFAEAIPNITVVEGSDVIIPCVVDSLGKYNVAWLQSDHNQILTIKYHTITNDPRVSITARNNRIWSLQIHDVQLYDKGRYECQVNTIPMKKNVVFLNVVVPPKIWVPDHQVAAAIQADVVLVCNMESDPRSVMYWKRHDDLPIIVPSSKYNTANLDAFFRVQMRLIIKNLGPEDFGSYACVAKNSFGEAQGNITLYEISEKEPSIKPPREGQTTIKGRGPPEIKIQDQLVGAALGENVTLGCTVVSHLSAMKYWTREEAVILISNMKYNVNPIDLDKFGAEMRLIIKDLKPNDFGSYVCIAKNADGETRGTITLYENPISFTSYYSSSNGSSRSTDKSIPELRSSTYSSIEGSTISSAEKSPKIRICKRRVKAAIGAEVTLVCTVRPKSLLLTYWKRYGDGLTVIPGTKYNIETLDAGVNKVQMRLTIKNLEPDDFGSYTCVAKNSLGEVERNITLKEKPKPKFLTFPSTIKTKSKRAGATPMIRISNQLVGAAIGDDITLVCNLRSNSRSVNYWRREGGGFMIISSTKYNSNLIDTGIHKVQMMLTIKNLGPDDFGTYACVAKNSAGEAEGNITLYEMKEPTSSTYPSSDDLTSGTAERN